MDTLWLDVGVSLVQVIHQHPSPLEPQHAGVAFVDEALVVARRYLSWMGQVLSLQSVHPGLLSCCYNLST